MKAAALLAVLVLVAGCGDSNPDEILGAPASPVIQREGTAPPPPPRHEPPDAIIVDGCGRLDGHPSHVLLINGHHATIPRSQLQYRARVWLPEGSLCSRPDDPWPEWTFFPNDTDVPVPVQANDVAYACAMMFALQVRIPEGPVTATSCVISGMVAGRPAASSSPE